MMKVCDVLLRTLADVSQGFDWKVWIMVLINAFGGIVVAVVIKFADNILKVHNFTKK